MSRRAETWWELTRLGEAGYFPPNWGQLMTDGDFWRPTIAALFAQHGLPYDGALMPGVEGSNAIYLTSDLVVMIYAAPWPVSYACEVECPRVLEGVPEA